jgi:Holliday junction resolvasome RuvABC endonuclease subunit
MILGLDISTSITGYALVDENTGELIEYGSFNLKKCKDVFEKALFMKGSLVELLQRHEVTKIFIEQPFTFFNSGGSWWVFWQDYGCFTTLQRHSFLDCL